MRNWMVLVAVAALLAGCAQGVWVRPGASQAEAALTFDQCGYEAALNTPQSDVHLGGRRTVGKALLEGVIDGIADGVRQGNLKSLCMQSHGFQQVPVAVAAAMARGPAPAPIPLAAVVATPLPPFGPPLQAGTPMAAEPLPQARLQPAMATEVYRPAPLGRSLMTLPTGSTVRHAFLLGACSAGDVTACIVTDAERPARPSLY